MPLRSGERRFQQFPGRQHERVGAGSPGELNGRGKSVFRFPYHLKVRLGFQQGPQTFAYNLMVVCNDNRYHSEHILRG